MLVKTIAVLAFLSVAVLFVSCSRTSLATQTKKESNTNEQPSNKNESLSVSQEARNTDKLGSKPELDPCGNTKNRVDLVDCLLSEFEKADRKMNALYNEYIARFRFGQYSNRKRDIANLANTQRAWLTYRDKNCKAVEDLFEGGTQQGEESVTCRLDMTKARIKELKLIYAPK